MAGTTNLTALAPITTLATALANLVLVSPQDTIGYQPQNFDSSDDGLEKTQQTPPPAFVFQYEGENTLSLESDITDHYVEDNTPIEDNIALRPPLYTVQGFIGELNDIAPDFLKPVKFVADKLTDISGYAPQLSSTAELAYAEAFFLYQTAANVGNSAVSAWATIRGTGGENVLDDSVVSGSLDFTNQTKQQIALQQLYGYWNERRLFTIQTPWAVLQDMAIHKIRAVQDGDTDKVSTFAIDFKQIRKASTLTSSGVAVSVQGRLQSQSSKVTNQGVSTPSQSTTSQSSLISAMA